MNPEIILLSKSMQCRLQEFEALLSDVEAPCSEIKKVWSSFFEDFVIPKFGWKALWLMSEESCIKCNVPNPTGVIVRVDSYDWDELAATVTVTEVQNDIVLPLMLDVPVIELHPLKKQEYDMYDLKIIADSLDKCRYFFRYIWYPWDSKKKMKISDWHSSHLQDRLQIQCELQNGVLNKNVAQYYKSLLAESKQIHESLIDIAADVSPNERINLMKACFRRKILKMELGFFQEPELRNDLMILRMGRDLNCENHKKEAKFVWEGGSMDALLLYISTVKTHIGNDIALKVSPSLQDALDSSFPGDNMFLPAGSHVLGYLSGLESGGMIKGLGNATETKIIADCARWKRRILFGIFGDFELQNVTIMGNQGTTIKLFEKTLKISNCRLISEKLASAIGIIVTSGSSLIIENCEIVGFDVGVTAESGSNASISNTKITDCSTGMKVGEKTELTVRNVEILNCSESAIRLQTTVEQSDLPKSGNIDLLSYFEHDFKFCFETLRCSNNKCDVVIANVSGSYAEDSFNSDAMSETVTISDDE